mgnify:CR=1 FL=1
MAFKKNTSPLDPYAHHTKRLKETFGDQMRRSAVDVHAICDVDVTKTRVPCRQNGTAFTLVFSGPLHTDYANDVQERLMEERTKMLGARGAQRDLNDVDLEHANALNKTIIVEGFWEKHPQGDLDFHVAKYHFRPTHADAFIERGAA